ncbi:MAG: lipid A phosphate methyltransferase [Micavibrio aeruginosavorus]|uniref:Lipid A phosphate methyltransferase n=1 Tax=Micavibrio aeruginosavorus TaxID=349221 RepID=A0A2W5HB48_9BACT|nr:MAG: lipid A phosphate methyltransferase [Micavibrio aeruginosavorus]
MSLYNSMIKSGHFFFRWRSYIPLLLIPPMAIAFEESTYVEEAIGDDFEDFVVLVCFIISLIGLAIRCFTVGFIPGSTSGRNTTEQRADHLNTSGMYSVVRNPLYLGNFIIILGVMLSIKVWWLVLIFSLVFFIYMEKIILAEENFLHEKFGERYDTWRAKTPVIVPRFSQWSAPEMTFSWKTVLKREYPALLAIGTAFFINEVITDLFIEGEEFYHWLEDDIIWPAMFGLFLIISLTLRYLKKHTRVLKVEGR